MTKEELQAAVDAVPYWYHKIALPNGITTPGWAPISAEAYRIPDDLTGKTVLDVGAWDGYWTFEALRKGAEVVTAIEDFSDTIGAQVNADRSSKGHTFDLCKQALGYGHDQVNLLDMSVYDVDKWSEYAVMFDYVFCFGVLYHLKHPLLALEKLHSVCKGNIHIETAILDGIQSCYTSHVYTGDECCFEFYPGSEYGANPSNWYVGTLKAWVAMVQSAGFKNVESWKLTEKPDSLAVARGFIRATNA
jgi:tRNA (mo5U34)-methyltransferase